MSKIRQDNYQKEYNETPNVVIETADKAVDIRQMNSGWSMRQIGSDNWINCAVPSTNFTVLHKAGIIDDPFLYDNENDLQWIEKEDWEFKMDFDISEEDMSNEKLELVFDGLDTFADIYLNGEVALQADNMFLKWHLSCKELLRVGQNELKIYFHSPLKSAKIEFDRQGIRFPAENDKTAESLSVFSRKAPYHYGWDWGPKFVTSGIWRPVSMRMINELVIRNVQIQQEEILNGTAKFSAVLSVESFEKQTVSLAAITNGNILINTTVDLMQGITDCTVNFSIEEAQLWWPSGMGEQNLYEIEFSVSGANAQDESIKKIGIRDFEVVRESDAHGEAFYFKVNGIPFFSKGANYIPSDSFLDRMTPDRYRQIFEDATAANMNTLRVWGGGIYEDDLFYDLADEYGVVIWQDFMFGCTMYPWDEQFLANVEKEAISNVRRLRNHPCIGLWCGNNEIQMGWDNWGWQDRFGYSKKVQEEMYAGYQNLFHQLLPKVVEDYDPKRFYLPSSPSSNWDRLENFNSGDQHYWGVWHGEEPFENFKKFVPRFMSEYGFQSFPTLESVQKYIKTEDYELNSETMMVHQKHPRGNDLIREYMLREYNEPKDFELFLYLSQIVQAEGMKVAFEAHRRRMPFCMGSLYWQLNDCWPAASWSGIDYYGRWKALHYFAKNAFEDLLISFDTKDGVLQCFLISDRLEKVSGKLNLEVMDFAGNKHYQKSVDVVIESNHSKIYLEEDISKLLKSCEPESSVLVAKFEYGRRALVESRFYFDLPKNLNLTNPDIEYQIEFEDSTAKIYLQSTTLVKGLYLSLEGVENNFSENFFDLLPYENKEVTVSIPEGYNQTSAVLKMLSVNNSYKS